MIANARWRITLKFTDGEAYDMTIEDCHHG
jgi:plasmid maintenance system killer protein